MCVAAYNEKLIVPKLFYHAGAYFVSIMPVATEII